MTKQPKVSHLHAVDTAPAPALGDGPLLTREEVAAMLGVSQRTLANHESAGTGPALIRITAKAIRYAKPDVLAWIETRRRAKSYSPDAA